MKNPRPVPVRTLRFAQGDRVFQQAARISHIFPESKDVLQRREIGVDARLLNGLRNFWYPIYRSEDLGSKPVGIKRLGEELVL